MNWSLTHNQSFYNYPGYIVCGPNDAYANWLRGIALVVIFLTLRTVKTGCPSLDGLKSYLAQILLGPDQVNPYKYGQKKFQGSLSLLGFKAGPYG